MDVIDEGKSNRHVAVTSKTFILPVANLSVREWMDLPFVTLFHPYCMHMDADICT